MINMRRVFTMATMLIAFTSVAMAEKVSFSAKYFDQRGYKVPASLPCNWNKVVEGEHGTSFFGYYGTLEEAKAGTLYQEGIVPIKKSRFGMSLLFELDPAIRTHANGKPLDHVDLEFKTNNKKCKTGFSMDQLSQ